MCGIAGIATSNSLDQAVERVGKMVHSLKRRGPDGEGIEVHSGAVLGHRRLAIFDLSEAGRQPMMSPDRSVSVVFNGAIYNFPRLRAELQSRGYQFLSNTDTEVLIHGYREWGLDQLVTRLHGMFAFALWDDRRNQIFLVRDRLGVKPLLYSVKNGQLAFASTVRALKSGGFVDEIDDYAVTEFLEFGFVTDARTIYKGAFKVPAASIVEFDGGEPRTRSYWSPPTVSPDSKAPSFEEAIEETERLFLRAVEMRLKADVPVGALLSGGVDSSLVCWAIAQLGWDVTAFTIGVPGDPWDETAQARETAQALGIPHRVLEISAHDHPGVEELIAAYGEPFACASALGMLKVSEAVAPLAKVLLTGDGGDDVFLGYPEHRHFWMAENVARGLPGVAVSGWSAVRGRFPRVGHLRRIASFLDYTTGGLGAVTATHDGLPVYERNGLLGERLAGAKLDQRTITPSITSARNLLSEFLAYDRDMRFVGEYMTKVDGATMYHGLEARSPFLDQELWSYAAGLPFELRLKGGKLKAVLRELARRKVGERVASGSKRGFGVPVQRWITGRWRGAVEESLRDSVLHREKWIDANKALAELNRAAESGWSPKQLWYIYVLETWFKHERDLDHAPGCESFQMEGMTA